MTEMQNTHCDPILFEHLTGWYEPPAWMRATDVDFRYREVRINGVIYIDSSNEFNEAWEKDSLFRILAE